jgi:hypothetical protein
MDMGQGTKDKGQLTMDKGQLSMQKRQFEEVNWSVTRSVRSVMPSDPDSSVADRQNCTEVRAMNVPKRGEQLSIVNCQF